MTGRQHEEASGAQRGVAIVGMACIFPGAPDLETFQRNLEEGVDAIRDVPAGRWEPVFYDPSTEAVDRFYARRGGFVDEYVAFDALAWGVMPVAVEGAEPDQLIALEVAARALADAGYADRPFPRDRTAVVLGRGNYVGAGMTRLEQHVRTAEQLVTALRTLVPGIGEARLAKVKAEFQSKLGGYGPDTAIGLVPNLTASRIANRLDLQGPAYTIDAACASSLIAVDQAVADLRAGRTDLALAGGVHLTHDVAFWSVFTQLGALSRRGEMRPFDRGADGILPGEGIGIVVLKRLADALRDDDRIYAVLRGCGTASDGRAVSLMVPSVTGQRLALERAWRDAGLAPSTIGLIEAHGTGTPVGDAAELETLRDFFGPAPADGRRAGLGTVKSMIGHAMPAAGAAGLIKAALAIHYGVLPPTLHCEEPREEVDATRFRIIQKAETWESSGGESGGGGADGLRVAGVNAFGFGGINAHVVLSDVPTQRKPRRGSVVGATPAHESVLLLSAASPEALAEALNEDVETALDRGPCRLALVDPSPVRRAKAAQVVRAGKARRGRDGLWYAPEGLLREHPEGRGKVAFLFPGVEAAFEPRVETVAAHFGRPVPPGLDAVDLEHQGAGVILVGRLLHEALQSAGVRPDAAAGHSVGEWAGMIVTRMIEEDRLEAFVAGLQPGSLDLPDVAYAAVGAAADKIAGLVAEEPDVVVSHDNCPHQSILCGPEVAVDRALARLRDARLLGQKMPFRSGFHSPMFAPFLAAHRANLAALGVHAGTVPLWSATTCAPYPADGAAIATLALDHLVRPVRFRELVEALHEDGVRAFVQLGTGSLVGFVTDTLRGRPHLAMSASVPQRSGIEQLRRVIAALWADGLDVDWAAVAPRREGKKRGRPILLKLGVPLVTLDTPLDLPRGTVGTGEGDPAEGAHPVLAGFHALLRDVGTAGDTVVRAWADGPKEGSGARPNALPAAAPPPPRPAPAPARAPLPKQTVTTRRLSVAAVPTLVDHCLLPQPEGWPDLADRNPVVPMTMSIRLMLDAAEAAGNGRVAVAVEEFRAHTWLAVDPPVDVVIRVDRVADDRVRVTLEGFNEGVVVLADAYPAAPAPAFAPLKDPRPSPVSAEALYADRWMFHGPAYQAVVDPGTVGSDGIDGVLQGLPAEGALLDAAGQLFGFWVMITTERDRLAMPIKVGKLALYGPEPATGERVRCAVRVRDVGLRQVRCDMELVRETDVGPCLWATVTGWTDWRFETDDRLWPVMHRTEDHLFAVVGPEGIAVVDDPDRSTASRDYLARRFLSAAERAEWTALHERRRSPWLYGRIAAKDAARHWLRAHGDRPRFPVELAIANDASGRPTVRGPFDADLRLSIAHKDTIAVALVREGEDVGVDVEVVAARDERLRALLTTADERALFPAGVDVDEWTTRFFCAKECVGKARGTGLQGSPRSLPVSDAVPLGDRVRLRCDGVWVATVRHGEHVIGWTEGE